MSPLRGIALKLTAVILFVVMASLVKAASAIPTGEVVFFRSFFALPVIIVWLLWRGDLVAEITVETPTKLSKRQREILEEFRETETGDECPESRGFFDRIKDAFGA